MPENEFEKQVQQKMSELRFAPSQATWEKVEKQIAEDKKRRRFLLWLPLFFLLAGGAAWYHYAGNYNKNFQTVTTNKIDSGANKGLDHKKNSKPVIKEEGRQDQKNTVANTAVQPGTSVASDKTVGTEKDNTGTIRSAENNIPLRNVSVNDKTGMAKVNRRKMKSFTVVKVSPDNNRHFPKDELPVKENRVSIHKDKAGSKEHPATKTEAAEELTASAVDAEIKNMPVAATAPGTDSDSTSAVNPLSAGTRAAGKTKTANNLENKPVDSTASVTTTKITIKTAMKIDWGITMNAGSSSLSHGFPGLVKNTNDLNYSSPQTGNGGNSSITTPRYTAPSEIKSSFSWSAGIFFSKPVSATLRISTGLNYTQFASHMKIGTRMDTATSSIVYRNDRSNSYTNRFHFIELPLLVEKQLGKASRFSINGGVSFSLLAGSNSLHFDQQKNIYYKDNSLLNKAQWNILAGINYRLLQKKARVELGPRFSYAPAGNLKKDGNDYGHWFFAGFNAKIFIGKIKK